MRVSSRGGEVRERPLSGRVAGVTVTVVVVGDKGTSRRGDGRPVWRITHRARGSSHWQRPFCDTQGHARVTACPYRREGNTCLPACLPACLSVCLPVSQSTCVLQGQLSLAWCQYEIRSSSWFKEYLFQKIIYQGYTQKTVTRKYNRQSL